MRGAFGRKQTPETTTVLLIHYTPKQSKKFEVWGEKRQAWVKSPLSQNSHRTLWSLKHFESYVQIFYKGRRREKRRQLFWYWEVVFGSGIWYWYLVVGSIGAHLAVLTCTLEHIWEALPDLLQLLQNTGFQKPMVLTLFLMVKEIQHWKHRLKHWYIYWLRMGPWLNYLSWLSLSFIFCKKGKTIGLINVRLLIRIKRDNAVSVS